MYEIANYEELYQPYDKSGRVLKRADFVKLPVNPKGDGLQVLLEQKRGLEVFAIWCLLLEKTTAQKSETRGKLLNFKDEAASISEIAKSISLPRKENLVEYALSLLVSMGWVKCDIKSPKTAVSRPLSLNKVKEKLNINKGYTPEFLNFWKNFKGRWNPEKGESGGYVKVGMHEAFLEFQKLTPAEQQKAIKNAGRVRGKFTPDACRWLKRKLFDDFRD